MNYVFGIDFPSDINLDGVFIKYKNFINYKCSETSSGKCDDILNGKNNVNELNFWKSTSDKNAYFEVNLEKGFFYPLNGVLLSCYDTDCIYNFSILGIEKIEKEYKEICFYEGSQDDFKGHLNLFPCIYKKPIKSFRIMQRGTNNQGTYKMMIRLLDFYGCLSFGNCLTKQKSLILFCIFDCVLNVIVFIT